jgi:hypothetical protein
MFDEISIRENLHFNQKFECIEGFEECGKSGQDLQHSKSCSALHDPWPTEKVEAASGLLLYSW